MRITKVFIEAFGIFCNYDLPKLGEGLTVIHGPNEAGKTTMLQFLRTILFGPPDGRSRRENRYPPLAGGKHGGLIRFISKDGEYILERDLTASKAPAQLILPGGQAGKQQDLERALGSVDDRLFRTVFAFSLQELEDLEALDRDALKNRLSSAAVVGSGIDAVDAAAQFRDRAAKLLSVRKGNSEVQERVDRIDELNTLISEAQAKASHYSELVLQIEQLRLATKRLGEEEEDTRAKHDRFLTLDELWPTWLEMSEAEQKLAGLRTVAPIPTNALERLGRTLDSVRSDGELQRSLESEQRADEAELAKLTVDEALVDVATEIGSLCDELALYRSRIVEIAQLSAQVEASELEIGVLLETIGMTEAELSRIDVSLPQREVIRSWQSRLQSADTIRESAEEEAQETAKELTASHEKARKLESDLQAIAAPPPLATIEEQERLLRKVDANYSDLRNEENALGHIDDSIADRERALRILEREQPPIFSGLSPILWLSGAAIAAGGIWAFIGKHDIAWTFALMALGIVLFVGAIIVQRLSSWAAGKKAAAQASVDGNKADLTRLKGEAEARTLRIEALRSGLQADCLALVIEGLSAELIKEKEGELQASRRKRSTVDQLTVELADAKRLVVEHEDAHNAARGAVERANTGHQTVLGEWRAWQSALNLPTTLTPAATIELCDKVGEYRAAVRAKDVLVKRRAQFEQETEQWAKLAISVAQRVGLDLSNADANRLPLEIQRLRDRCAHEQKQLERWRALSASIERRGKKLASANETLASSEAALQTLFDEAGVADEQQFRENVEIYEERQRHLDAISARTLAISRRSGSDENAETIARDLSTGALLEWQTGARQTKEQIDTIKTTRDKKIDELSQLEQQRQALEQSTEIASLEMERAALLEEIATAVREWQTCTVAELLITRTMEDFRRNRQPKVLSEASKAFATVTGNRYDRIVSDAEKDHDLAILTPDGKRKAVDELSRGTQEQLYLCLRLGLTTEIATESALPFIMDDVLVNFDEIRAENVAKALLELARDRQVLLFTCHRSTVALFQKLSADTPIVELRANSLALATSRS